ncbi:C2 family cysteine protease [Brachybacterium alimentarium]|uniref:C2 family cysteine protease n=2 Tax=Brachybacterium alimentarium TaxID=47845 RepID=UPI000DF196BB|nr:hypothetical protein CIK69_07315 [Brachybacterium alimentarium]
MFLGAETEGVRAHADAVRAGASTMATLLGALRSSTAGVDWRGGDRSQFDARAQDAWAGTTVMIDVLRRLAEVMDAEAQQQDEASAGEGHGAADLLANGRRDQDDPEIVTGKMRDAVPYRRSEEEAERNIGSRGVDQGSVNDCWFLASLMGIAERDPEYIREHLWRNDDGTWTVQMYRDGEPVEIIVDSEFSPDAVGHRVPVLDADGEVILGSDGQPMMRTEAGGWPAIYEKAAAEYRSEYGDSSYESLDYGWGDEAYEMLTPGDVERTGQSGFAGIRERFESGPVTVASEHPQDARLYPYWEGRVDDATVVPRHEYNVAGFVTAGEPAPDGTVSSEDRIHLENPWGPDGGSLDGTARAGDLFMTEDEYRENFRGVSSVDMGG